MADPGFKTTVIVPNYIGIDYLRKCIESLNRAKETHYFAVLVVDNGSDDGSLELARYYEQEGACKVLSFPDNRGFSAAINAGVDMILTEYALLLNNDTVIKKDFVYELEKFMDEHPDAFSVTSKMITMFDPDVLDGTGDFYTALGYAIARGKGKSTEFYEEDDEVFSACAGAAIYRKGLIQSLGRFDENHFCYMEDVDIGYRALINGYKNYYCHSAEVFHAGSAASGSRYNKWKVELAARNNVYVAYKNMPLLQYLINLPLLIIGVIIKQVFFIRKKMGTAYITGVIKGIGLCLSRDGRMNKVRFRLSNLGNYVKIQLKLWGNITKLLTKY